MSSDPLLSCLLMVPQTSSDLLLSMMPPHSTTGPPWTEEDEENVLMEFEREEALASISSQIDEEEHLLTLKEEDKHRLSPLALSPLTSPLLVNEENKSRHHQQQLSDDFFDSSSLSIRGCEEDKNMHHCGVCKLVFADATALTAHSDSYAARLTCCYCSKRFISTSKLLAHRRKHSKEKPFQCGSCGKFYTHRTTLARHQLHYCHTLRAKCEDSTIIGGFPRDLNDGDLTIANLSELNVTNRLLPEMSPEKESKPAKTTTTTTTTRCHVCARDCSDGHWERYLRARTCCLCARVLGNRSKLLTHHRSHTKESPYACAFCGRRFAESSTLRKHEATHGAKNFTCGVCGKGFVRKDYLAKHTLTHRQTYRCAFCPFISHERSAIEAHVSTHQDQSKNVA